MDPETRDAPAARELHELRRRIYGPSRDQEHDPAAHARLLELESVRAPAPAAGDALRAESEDSGSAPAPEEPAAPETAPETAPSPDPAHAAPSLIDRVRARLTPRTLRAAQAAALILVIAGTAATTAWITREPGETVAVLPLRIPVEISLTESGSSGGGTVTTAEFHGLTPQRLPGNRTDQQIEEDCLSIVQTVVDRTSIVGAYGCGAGAVRASVPMMVTDDLPEDLREAFPIGTTLVFDLEDDVVRVRALAVGMP